jgi:MOSC domain-containing protein YiiM
MRQEACVRGSIVQISVSGGGVPKCAVPEAEVTADGLVGDAHRNLDVHGGPERAVCLYALELLESLAREGHAAAPGRLGENVTVRGLHWPDVLPGARLRLGLTVVLQVSAYAAPCRTIAHVFQGQAFGRISAKTHPGESRVYARVLVPGRIHTGDTVELLPP